MLTVTHANHVEALLLRLSGAMGGAGTDPFAPETIVVQNPGMGRWLTQMLAAQQGVTAGLDMALPASFFWRVFRAWRPDLPEASGFDRDALAWRVYALLPALASQPAFAELTQYLAGESRALKRWQLARQIADAFDQYLVYRPDLVLRWEDGDGNDWQARLWRRLVAGMPGAHRARLLAELRAAFDAGMPPREPGLLPGRVALFGLTALPPAYCGMLQVLAAHRDVHLFLLNPCMEYWADIVDERGQARRRARAEAARQHDPGALLDLGNPLLAALGHTGQAFLDVVLELEGESEDLFLMPTGERLLTRIQRDILTLTDPRRDTAAERPPLPADDDSILVHRCHGPLREVQVLHDRLLALIEEAEAAGRPLEPRDILVMAPDIDGYAPFIDAVFGAAPAERRLPWSIADRRLGTDEPLLAAFSELLALPLSRLTAADVLGWLEVPAIARRFELTAADIDRVRTWVRETGIRWGFDADMRGDLGLPAEDANTWSFGLQRLFLGYALTPDVGLYEGTSPYPDVEGDDAVVLGQLQTFVERLGHWHTELARARPAGDWRHLLNAMIDGLFAPDDDEEPLIQRLREALDDLAAQAEAAGLDEPLEPELIRVRLQEVIAEPAGASRFLTGRVTFCNMVPMRSIPARVIGLLGMNGTDFPRSQRRPSFDLVARHPRRGDRSRRHDDRYLFLEVILSARDHLHISYVGRDLRDNSLKVASVVVDELLDVIDRGYRIEAGNGAEAVRPSAHLVIDHPLQPFSPRCFDGADPRLWSYAGEWLPAPAGRPEAASASFADATLAEAAPEVIELTDLIRFLKAPARWFLERRLRLRLPQDEAPPEDAEPFVLDGLERWTIRQELLDLTRRDVLDQALPRLKAEGVLPHGEAGPLLLGRQIERVQRFHDALSELEAGVEDGERRVELDLPVAPGGGRAPIQFRGWLDGVTGAGLIGHRLGRLRAVDLLELWVRHLALNAAIAVHGLDSVMPHSRFLAETRDELTRTELDPVPDAADRLGDLCGLFLDGQQAPLTLFPESSLAWAEYGDLGKVMAAWNDSWNGPAGEGSDAAVQIAFRGRRDPLGADFQRLAERVFGPLLAVRCGDER